MYECEIGQGQGLLGNSVARAMGGAVQDATLPVSVLFNILFTGLAGWGLGCKTVTNVKGFW